MSYQCNLQRNLNVLPMADSSPNWQALVARDWHLWDWCQRLISDHFHLTFLPRPPMKAIVMDCSSNTPSGQDMSFWDSFFHPITSLMVAIVLCVDLIVASLAHRWGVSQVQSITFGRFFNHSLQKAFTTDYNSVLVIKHFLGSWKTDLDHDTRFFQLSSFWSDMWKEIVYFDVCTSNEWQRSIRVMVMAPNFNV